MEAGELVVPAITIFEVLKCLMVQGMAHAVPQVESPMRRFPVVELSAERASAAAALAVKHKLPMADSTIYAAAQLRLKAPGRAFPSEFCRSRPTARGSAWCPKPRCIRRVGRCWSRQ